MQKGKKMNTIVYKWKTSNESLNMAYEYEENQNPYRWTYMPRERHEVKNSVQIVLVIITDQQEMFER